MEYDAVLNIVVDINHPAHVHYFKNFIWQMEKAGHKILITASEKEVSYRLLDAYNFKYIKLGSYGKTLGSKLWNLFQLDYRMYEAVKNFNPDLFIGFGSIRAAHISSLLNKPCINLDDSEPTPQEHILYVPFSDYILTPSVFRKSFGKKQITFDSYIELAYLHPDYFVPDPSILSELGLSKNDDYFLIRLVGWNATHDIGRKGISNPIKLIEDLEQKAHVFISSENELPSSLNRYKLNVPPEKIHDVMYFAKIFICDGQTMTTESALLGTPAIRCNNFVGPDDMGNFIELEKKYGLIYNVSNEKEIISLVYNLMNKKNLKYDWSIKRKNLLNDKIDVTKFIIDFIDHNVVL